MRVAPIALASALLVASCSPKKKADSKTGDDTGAAAGIEISGASAEDMQPELLVLRQVLVEESGDQGDLTLPAEKMAKQLGGQLVTSGFLAAREGDVPDTHQPRRVEILLSVSYDWAPEAEPQAGALVLAAEARIEFVEGRGEMAPRAAVLMEASVPRPESVVVDPRVAQEALRQLSEAATGALAESLVSRERLRRASHAELLSALSLGLKEPDMRIWALQLAAERGLREAVPAAIAALDAENEDLQAVAISVLVELRDQRAVPALIKRVDFNSHEELRIAIEAITAIGGDEASEFLEFVASGHSDRELRARAKENLEELRRPALGE